MRITADSNMLLRIVLNDDPSQSALAAGVLARAERVAVPTAVWCEIAWMLHRRHVRGTTAADALEALRASQGCVTDRELFDEGLRWLRAGGGFADGVIAQEGARMGGTLFVSFDQDAVALRRNLGGRAATPVDLASA